MARRNYNTATPNVIATPSQAVGTDPLILSPVNARYIDVLQPGVLHVETANGEEAVYTFAGYDPTEIKNVQAFSCFPYRLRGQISRVIYDGASPTTIDPTDLIFWG